ncbi:MAG: L,D-transpeptidase [Nitrospirota bacterium]
MSASRKIQIALITFFAIFLVIEGIGLYIGARNRSGNGKPENDKTVSRKVPNQLKARNYALKQRLGSLTPDTLYIVIDTGRNLLFLKRGERTIHEAVISSGSGNVLKDPSGKRQWVFDTPRGEYTVQTKYISPAWTKPDWAFIEEGEAIPKNLKDRVEEGVLGDYALGFGKGYFIHGTLYTRLLGRNVTHGCIRVGDKDLKTIFAAAGIGTKIYIF